MAFGSGSQKVQIDLSQGRTPVVKEGGREMPSYSLKQVNYSVRSFEIYNDEFMDLLEEDESFKVPKNKQNTRTNSPAGNRLVFRDFQRPVSPMGSKKKSKSPLKGGSALPITETISGFTEMKMVHNKDIERFLEKVQKNKSTAETALNRTSSRSHTFYHITAEFIYEFQNRESMAEEGLKAQNEGLISQESTICVVDLAGSERFKRTEAHGNEFTEMKNINKSLLALGRCFVALLKGERVPVRDSKLTHVLFNYFYKKNNIIMIANVNPSIDDFEESTNVLDYTYLAKNADPKMSPKAQSDHFYGLTGLGSFKRELELDTTSVVSMSKIMERPGLESDDSQRSSFLFNNENRETNSQVIPPQTHFMSEDEELFYQIPESMRMYYWPKICNEPVEIKKAMVQKLRDWEPRFELIRETSKQALERSEEDLVNMVYFHKTAEQLAIQKLKNRTQKKIMKIREGRGRMPPFFEEPRRTIEKKETKEMSVNTSPGFFEKNFSREVLIGSSQETKPRSGGFQVTGIEDFQQRKQIIQEGSLIVKDDAKEPFVEEQNPGSCIEEKIWPKQANELSQKGKKAKTKDAKAAQNTKKAKEIAERTPIKQRLRSKHH